MKVKECNKCGCDRKIMVKSKIKRKNIVQYDLDWLCVPCFLKVIGLIEVDKHKDGEYNYNKAMKIQNNMEVE